MLKDIICADIGGTHCRFAHFILNGSTLTLCKQNTFSTHSINNTTDLLNAVASCGISTQDTHFFCVGVAGVIDSFVDGYGLSAKLTNAPLTIDFKNISCLDAGKNFLLNNDFALQAWASLVENAKMLPILGNIPPNDDYEKTIFYANRGIVGAGTGLGVAALIPSQRNSWTLMTSEGGHSDMAFHGKEENEFASFAKDFLQKSRLSAEDILCAKGLSVLYAFFLHKTLSPQEVAQTLWHDGKVGQEQYESQHLKLYARFLGRFCRNWALNTLCLGGLYLGGGVLMKNEHILKSNSFKQEFYMALNSHKAILQKIPVILMQQEHCGLWGGAYLARQILLEDR